MSTMNPPRPRYQPTAEECRRGGQAAAAKLIREQRRAGGVCRSRQPSFRELQRRRGRKGAAVVLARYGPRALVEILAAYYRAHPTSLERFVHGVLRGFGVPFETQRVVEVTPGAVCWRLDVVLPGRGPGGADLVIEPGATYWHDPVRDAVRAATLARLGYPYLLTLTDTEIRETPDLARLAIQIFLVDPWPSQSWNAERGTRNE
jgi:hypothetical protein